MSGLHYPSNVSAGVNLWAMFLTKYSKRRFLILKTLFTVFFCDFIIFFPETSYYQLFVNV